MKKEIELEVNIKKSGSGYVIELQDEVMFNSLAITRAELEKIVLYGQKILKDN